MYSYLVYRANDTMCVFGTNKMQNEQKAKTESEEKSGDLGN